MRTLTTAETIARLYFTLPLNNIIKNQNEKKTIFLAAILFFAFTANSQVTKGNWLVGDNINFSSTNYKSDAGSKSVGFDFKLTPKIGCLIADKFATG